MNQLAAFLEDVKARLDSGERPRCVDGPFGSRGVCYDEDEDGQGVYAVIGFNLPAGVFAEIDDGTFGNLHGFRIYLGESVGDDA